MPHPPRSAAIALLALLLTTTLALPAPAAEQGRPKVLIDGLGLAVLPRESGYLGLIGRSAQQVPVGPRSLAVQSQNYYLLTRDRPVNFLHHLQPDDTHVLIEGGPVAYYVFCDAGPGARPRVWKQVLGRDLAAGERPVIAVPGGCWKALVLSDRADYALMANALSPEFTPDRVTIGADAAWIARFAGSAPWATPDFLRRLVGPNLTP